ncbi:uncharacterized protein [Clytia hemisphaerica]|uniref:Ig-like domain-containing protein n=1 Tax=Clytia hemisphaerica TaxID=252671 RepID=A0A7M5X2X5_9CNID
MVYHESKFFILWLFCHSVYCASFTPAFFERRSDEKSCKHNIDILKDSEQVKIFEEEENRENYPMNFFFTPGFPKISYPANLTCTWHIKGRNGTGLFKILFDYVDVEYSKGCHYDKVRVYKKGFGQHFWEKVGKTMCGMMSDYRIEFIAESVFVLMESDDTIDGAGFNGTFSLDYPENKPIIKCIGLLNDPQCSRQITVKKLSSINLICQAQGDPTPVSQWMRWVNDTTERIEDSILKDENTDGNAILHNIRLSDAGFYQCSTRNKHGHEEQLIELTVEDRCICKKYIEMAWFDFPPYTPYVDGYLKRREVIIKGIFYEVIQKMVDDICGTCPLQGETVIVWNRQMNMLKPIEVFERDVQQNQFSVAFPLLMHRDIQWERFKELYFLPVVDHPGYVYLQKRLTGDSQAIFRALAPCTVIFIMLSLITICAGQIMWFLELRYNKEEFPPTVLQGFSQGIWWSFATATTVGYGDVTPRGFPGRVFSVIWIFGGIIMVSITVGQMITSLTLQSIKTKGTIPVDTKVGVLNQSDSHYYAVRLTNAAVREYDVVQELVNDVQNGRLDGCLVDAYVADFNSNFHMLEKQATFTEREKKYGVVFNESVIDPATYNLFNMYMKSNEQLVQNAIDRNTGDFPETLEKQIVDPENNAFQMALVSLVAMCVVFGLAGILYDYAYKQPNTRYLMEMLDYNMIEETSEVYEKAHALKKLKKETLYGMEDIHEGLLQKMETINRKHDTQQKKFKDWEAHFNVHKDEPILQTKF